MGRFLIRIFLPGILVFLWGCSSTKPESSRTNPPEPYVRVVETGSNVVQLQIAARKFLPANRTGPVIWLTGVSHIGETAYYAALQRHLDEQTLVLFEGVSQGANGRQTLRKGANGSRSHGAGEAGPATSAAAMERGERAGEDANAPRAEPAGEDAGAPRFRRNGLSSLQTSLSDALGLTFQLEAIDYRRPNFRNSDLSVQELRELAAGKDEQEAGPVPAAGQYSREEHGNGSGSKSAAKGMDALVDLMEGNSLWGSLLQMGMRFIGSSPLLKAMSRLALIETLGQIQGDPSQLSGLPPEMKDLFEVLIQRRNQHVIADVKAERKRVGPHGSIALFYGAGHMSDLERRMRQQLHYQPVEDLWLSAFSVDLKQARISPSQREFIRKMVKAELGVKESLPLSSD